MKSKITLLFLFILLSSQLRGQWIELNSGTDVLLRGVCFIDSNEGIVVGLNGTLLKTFNAGATWTQIGFNTSEHLHDIFFADDQTGYIVGSNGLVLKSNDRGNTWTIVKEEAS